VTVPPLVLIRVGTRWCGVPARDVREIELKGGLARVPGAPRHVLGVALVRGRMVPVVELDGLFGGERGASVPTLPRLVVLARSDGEIALVAEEVQIVDDAVAVEGLRTRAPFVHAEAEWRGGAIALLDTGLLMNSVLGGPA
jgi:purine-binding chemotaxis protein CheW